MGESAKRQPLTEVHSSQGSHLGSEKAGGKGISVATHEALRFAGAGMELGGSSIVCAAIGYAIDHYFQNTTLVATALGAIFGFAGGLYRFIRLAMAANRPDGPVEK